MKLLLLTFVKSEDGMHSPGETIDRIPEAGERLIRLRAAIAVKGTEKEGEASGDSDTVGSKSISRRAAGKGAVGVSRRR